GDGGHTRGLPRNAKPGLEKGLCQPRITSYGLGPVVPDNMAWFCWALGDDSLKRNQPARTGADASSTRILIVISAAISYLHLRRSPTPGGSNADAFPLRANALAG